MSLIFKLLLKNVDASSPRMTGSPFRTRHLMAVGSVLCKEMLSVVPGQLTACLSDLAFSEKRWPALDHLANVRLMLYNLLPSKGKCDVHVLSNNLGFSSAFH